MIRAELVSWQVLGPARPASARLGFTSLEPNPAKRQLKRSGTVASPAWLAPLRSELAGWAYCRLKVSRVFQVTGECNMSATPHSELPAILAGFFSPRGPFRKPARPFPTNSSLHKFHKK